ncbi:MAG: hypothetical protein RBT34_09365 [Anaerolineaceae bacterium]|jgi:hypothetical protein|nr:hypothetical protein [Anaerolineaceae bacterium]
MQNLKSKDQHTILAAALQLDIFNLNYVFSSRIFIRFLAPPGRVLPQKGLLIRIAVFVKHMLDQLNFQAWKDEQHIPQNAFIFFAESQNQKDSLKPVVDCLKNSFLIGENGDYSFQKTKFKGYLYSIPFLFFIFYHFIKSKGIQKKSFYYNFDRYWFTYGFYIAARKWLRGKKPVTLSMSNDHVVENRVMLKAAQDEGIPVIYFQHASVTDEFPPLTYDYAFLEGQDALKTYSEIAPSRTKVFLIGAPKFDKYRSFTNQNEKVGSIGICTNLQDPVEKTEEILTRIQKEFSGLKIYFRPHPSEKKKHVWQAICSQRGLIYSDPNGEESFEFLRKVDCVIAGNSNIHLEAALLNVVPLFYDFSEKGNRGSYSFVSQGLCEFFFDPDCLIQKILELTESKENVRGRAKYYIDTIGSHFDGLSSKLARSLYEDLFISKRINDANWYLLDNANIEAYSQNETN